MGSQNLRDNAQTTRDEIDEWALCVAAYPEMAAHDIAYEMPYRGRHMRVSTVGVLRDRGFEVVPDHDPEGGYVHALLKLPIEASQEPSDEEWEEVWDELRDCFGPREDNPAYEARR